MAVAVNLAIFDLGLGVYAIGVVLKCKPKLVVQNVVNTITGEEKIVSDEIQDAEKYLEGIEKQYGSQLPQWLNWGPFKSVFGGGSGNYGAAR